MQRGAEASKEHPADPFAELVHAVSQSLLSSAIMSSSSASLSPMARPVTFSGEEEDCSRFLLQCSIQDATTTISHRKGQDRISHYSLDVHCNGWDQSGIPTDLLQLLWWRLQATLKRYLVLHHLFSIHDELFLIRQGKTQWLRLQILHIGGH